ncbi:putative uncharacterized protein DDB_G0281733 [Temnothorax curvispinosus]|uniref:Uncharacterized protein n=1 Tax=Temnothorax curvispinosus TaxID=300111 RepID=A0A6J1Q3Q4_9HYME|nr:putative uncharacterized protein DDB_G0281733 [Temnothorax curvispinosus]
MIRPGITKGESTLAGRKKTKRIKGDITIERKIQRLKDEDQKKEWKKKIEKSKRKDDKRDDDHKESRYNSDHKSSKRNNEHRYFRRDDDHRDCKYNEDREDSRDSSVEANGKRKASPREKIGNRYYGEPDKPRENPEDAKQKQTIAYEVL